MPTLNGAPLGRPKNDKPPDQWTKKELVAAFGQVGMQYGTYAVSDRTATIRTLIAKNPANEGGEWQATFRVERDTLELTAVGQAAVNRCRRVK